VAVPAPSTLSIIGRVIRQRLKSDPFHGASNFDVTIDTPAAVARSQQESTCPSLLNLFFYRIEPSGILADAGAHDRWYVRVLCMITPFSTTETVDDPKTASTIVIPAGEIDLRVLGEVLRYFHENPIIRPASPEEDVGVYLQVVPLTLSSQEINEIWSTQGDVAYRPSLLYEIALLPIEPRTRASPSLPVVAGGPHLHMRATIGSAGQPAPTPPAVWVSPRLESGDGLDWVPCLAFVAGGVATQSISISSAGDRKVFVWIAGRPAVAVRLVWQTVNRGVWEPVAGAGGSVDTTVPVQPTPPGNGFVDPAVADVALTVAATVPVAVPAQLLLHAERTTAGGVVLKSNPLIVTVVP
jgi:hypothetical protein